jgi:PAS domain S-box-containing protein
MTSPLILIAFPQSPERVIFERALRSAGYQVALAETGSEAEKIFQESIPSLVLLHASFEKNGLDFAAALLERFPTMPVVLYEEAEKLASYRRALQTGISGYLFPPLRIEDLQQTIERSLQRARRLGDWLRHEVKRTTASLEKRIELSEAERRRYEIVFASIEDGVILVDTSGKILMINPAAQRIFGITQAQAEGKLLLEAIQHPDLRDLMARSGEKHLSYHEINFADGRVYHAQITPLPNIGQAITLHDITYLKEIDRMKNDFVNTISHDIRSPLTAVLGYTELIERVGPLNDQQRIFLGRIRTSVENITALVNDLLDLNRLEAGFDTRRERVHLDALLSYSLDLLRPLIDQKGLQLEVKIASPLPALRGNPLRLRQMLENLIGNAIKYTPSGGRIEISLYPQDSQIVFKISDTGPGIPPEEQSRIFEKFYRASNVTAESSGFGLGLAIVKSIVENHQGRVWVESALGKGTTFYVVLPAERQP